MTGFDHATFDAFLGQHRLMGVRCRACGTVHLPPHPTCPACHSDRLDWVELTGAGRLAAFTVVYTAPTRMVAAGYGREHPYCCGIIRLAEGPAISAQIIDVDPTQPERIRIGMALQVAFTDRAGQTVLAFRPA